MHLIERLEELEKSATPAPWWTYNGQGVFSDGQEGLSLGPSWEEGAGVFLDCDNLREDCDLIVELRNNNKAILRALKAAKSLLEPDPEDDLAKWTEARIRKVRELKAALSVLDVDQEGT